MSEIQILEEKDYSSKNEISNLIRSALKQIKDKGYTIAPGISGGYWNNMRCSAFAQDSIETMFLCLTESIEQNKKKEGYVFPPQSESLLRGILHALIAYNIQIPSADFKTKFDLLNKYQLPILGNVITYIEHFLESCETPDNCKHFIDDMVNDHKNNILNESVPLFILVRLLRSLFLKPEYYPIVLEGLRQRLECSNTTDESLVLLHLIRLILVLFPHQSGKEFQDRMNKGLTDLLAKPSPVSNRAFDLAREIITEKEYPGAAYYNTLYSIVADNPAFDDIPLVFDQNCQYFTTFLYSKNLRFDSIPACLLNFLDFFMRAKFEIAKLIPSNKAIKLLSGLSFDENGMQRICKKLQIDFPSWLPPPPPKLDHKHHRRGSKQSFSKPDSQSDPDQNSDGDDLKGKVNAPRKMSARTLMTLPLPPTTALIATSIDDAPEVFKDESQTDQSKTDDQETDQDANDSIDVNIETTNIESAQTENAENEEGENAESPEGNEQKEAFPEIDDGERHHKKRKHSEFSHKDSKRKSVQDIKVNINDLNLTADKIQLNPPTFKFQPLRLSLVFNVSSSLLMPLPTNPDRVIFTTPLPSLFEAQLIRPMRKRLQELDNASQVVQPIIIAGDDFLISNVVATIYALPDLRGIDFRWHILPVDPKSVNELACYLARIDPIYSRFVWKVFDSASQIATTFQETSSVAMPSIFINDPNLNSLANDPSPHSLLNFSLQHYLLFGRSTIGVRVWEAELILEKGEGMPKSVFVPWITSLHIGDTFSRGATKEAPPPFNPKTLINISLKEPTYDVYNESKSKLKALSIWNVEEEMNVRPTDAWFLAEWTTDAFVFKPGERRAAYADKITSKVATEFTVEAEPGTPGFQVVIDQRKYGADGSLVKKIKISRMVSPKAKHEQMVIRLASFNDIY